MINKDFSKNPNGLGILKCVIPVGTGTLMACENGMIYRTNKQKEIIMSWSSFDSLFKRYNDRPNVKR